MPLRRYIFNSLTVVSLLLLLATVGLWVDNAFYVSYMSFDRSGNSVYLGSSYSELFFGLRSNNLHTKPGFQFYRYKYVATETEPIISGWRYSYWGFSLHWRVSYYGTDTEYVLGVPHWFLTLLFAIGPGVWFIKWRKRRRLAMAGKCPACGYDLTGNESGVCPECGEGADGVRV